jgi:hypothetical protein
LEEVGVGRGEADAGALAAADPVAPTVAEAAGVPEARNGVGVASTVAAGEAEGGAVAGAEGGGVAVSGALPEARPLGLAAALRAAEGDGTPPVAVAAAGDAVARAGVPVPTPAPEVPEGCSDPVARVELDAEAQLEGWRVGVGAALSEGAPDGEGGTEERGEVLPPALLGVGTTEGVREGRGEEEGTALRTAVPVTPADAEKEAVRVAEKEARV